LDPGSTLKLGVERPMPGDDLVQEDLEVRIGAKDAWCSILPF